MTVLRPGREAAQLHGDILLEFRWRASFVGLVSYANMPVAA